MAERESRPPISTKGVKTDLDEFLENYKADPLCLLQILPYLDFDKCGYTRYDDTPDELLENHPTIKRIYPTEGFTVAAWTAENCRVFINICHCEDIQTPSNALLDTLLNMTDDPPIVNLPLSLGKPHRERYDTNKICLCFDVIISTHFYESQVIKYELLCAYIISLCATGINNKYYNTILVESCIRLNKPYHGTMPKQYIDRGMSSLMEDRMMARAYINARAANVLKWAKTRALKRLEKLRAEGKLPSSKLEENEVNKHDSQSSSSIPETKKQPRSVSRAKKSKLTYEIFDSRRARLTSSHKRARSVQKGSSMKVDVIKSMKYIDLDDFIRVGLNVETDFSPFPTIIPPGPWSASIAILRRFAASDDSHEIDYELLQLPENDPKGFVLTTVLSEDTVIEEVAVFVSEDRLIVCDEEGNRFIDIRLPSPICSRRVRIVVNHLKITIYMPFALNEISMRYSGIDDLEVDQEVPNIY